MRKFFKIKRISVDDVMRNILTFVFIVKSSFPNKTFIMLKKK